MVSATSRAASLPSLTLASLPSLPWTGLPPRLGMWPLTYSMSPTRTAGTRMGPLAASTFGSSSFSLRSRSSCPGEASSAAADADQGTVRAASQPRPAPAASQAPRVSKVRRSMGCDIGIPPWTVSLHDVIFRLDTLRETAERERPRFVLAHQVDLGLRGDLVFQPHCPVTGVDEHSPCSLI